ncbi:MAG: enoyl-CoA hydratase/isomerase family protein, partial [Chloroflexota bacterium]
MVYETILIDKEESFATISLNRPKQLNAVNQQTFGEIGQALDVLKDDEAVRAVIITGSGDRAFSAGADISDLQRLETAEEGSAHSRSSHNLLRKMHSFPKPIIMAINGYALGGGLELAMGGDIILAAENAKLGQPEVSLGIIPGFGGSQRLPRLVGRTKALELILTGETISAGEALRIGLVNRVVPAGTVLAAAKDVARTIARKGPLAITLAKRAVYEGLEESPSAGNEIEIRYFGEAVGTDDRKEGT